MLYGSCLNMKFIWRVVSRLQSQALSGKSIKSHFLGATKLGDSELIGKNNAFDIDYSFA